MRNLILLILTIMCGSSAFASNMHLECKSSNPNDKFDSLELEFPLRNQGMIVGSTVKMPVIQFNESIVTARPIFAGDGGEYYASLAYDGQPAITITNGLGNNAVMASIFVNNLSWDKYQVHAGVDSNNLKFTKSWVDARIRFPFEGKDRFVSVICSLEIQ